MPKAVDSEQYTAIEFDNLKDKYPIKSARFFDPSNKLIKRLESDHFEQLSDFHWSQTQITMYDLREKRKTELIRSNRETNK